LALGSDETARRVYDVLLGAFSQAAPQQSTAAGCGTTSSLYLAGPNLLHREELAGGCGGGSATDVELGRSWLSRGGRSLPSEILERRLPVRVLRHTVRKQSGGPGLHPGSDGELREFELLADLDVTLAGERRRRPPYGLAGGNPGAVGRDSFQPEGLKEEPVRLPEKVCFAGHAGDRLIVQSPGGGGHGDPQRAAFFASLLT
jgi:N-methylhydantoinase B